MSKGIIYYTDNRLENLKRDWRVPYLAIDSIKESGLPIVSCSLKKMDLGRNIVLKRKPSVVTYHHQILEALKAQTTDYVFFCEHDVVYHKTHFDFNPPRDDTFYYNTNVFKCHPRRNMCVTYDHLRSVSGICVQRELAVEHYERKLKYIYDNKFNEDLGNGNPHWARKLGYEPGKDPSRGGFRHDKIDEWRSEYPNLDIRHRLTMTMPKMSLDDFVVKPTNWQKVTIDKVPGWDIKEMFL